MPLTPEQQNDLRRRQGALSGLAKNPSWQVFVAESERKIEKLQKIAMNMALAPEGADQRKLDEIRGFINALRWSIVTPTVAENSLNQFLRAQGIAVTDDE